MIRNILFSLFLVILSLSSYSQGQKCACCTEQHRQFDFWIGEWEVFDDKGVLVGTNTIDLVQDSCVIRENWISVSGGTGTSYNYYNPVDSTWNQLWVDNDGGSLNLHGKLQYGEMVLKTIDLYNDAYIQSYQDKISWTPLDDGSVRQYWERSTNAGKAWIVVFNGLYVRKE